MSSIKRYEPGSPEYQNLARAAALMTGKSPRGYHYTVGDCYFDFGQGWVWTTILSDGGEWGGYQALNPREQEMIVLASSVAEIEAVVDEVFADKYCPDRIK